MRRSRSASAWSVPSGQTMVHDFRPPFRSIRWTLKSPTARRRTTRPPYRLQNMTNVLNPVDKRAHDVHATGSNGHHEPHKSRSVR